MNNSQSSENTSGNKLPLKLKPHAGVMVTPQEPLSSSVSSYRVPQERKIPNVFNIFMYAKPLAWTLFLLIGGVMAALRYGGWLNVQEPLAEYAHLITLALHIWIVLLALNEDFFSGILCLFIPGYSFYYLLFKSERIFLLATFCGLLIGVGEDTLLFVQEFANRHYSTITDFFEAH